MFKKFFCKTLKNSQQGLTLVEIMVVMTILGILATLVIINVTSQMKEAKVNATKAQINTFENALELYRLRCNRYPTTEQGLEALLVAPSISPLCKRYPEGGFIKKNNIPADPWDGPFEYGNPGNINTGGIDIWSLGPNEEEGGGDDIGNWEEQQSDEY